MRKTQPTRLDRLLAGVCQNCPVCRTARKNQQGAAFWLVKKVEARLCPFCRAYERVYGRKAHAAPTNGASRQPSGISPNA
jgi:hypothetical protein